MSTTASVATRTVRFQSYGEPAEVLRLEETTLPGPASQRIRVKVQACGLNPADWALCRGLFAGSLPRGIGLEVAGTVDAVGEEVTDVKVGQLVFGPVDFVNTSSAGLPTTLSCSTGRPFRLDWTCFMLRLCRWQSRLHTAAWIASASKRERRC